MSTTSSTGADPDRLTQNPSKRRRYVPLSTCVARTASDAPSERFLTDLHRRLATRMPRGQQAHDPLDGPHATRRQVVVGASAAALAGSAGIVAGAATAGVIPDGHSRAEGP
jgi:cytochrome b6-f complex iron-sulfur subunit